MGKFGKKNHVSTDITRYSIAILGCSGIGKTTLMKETCEKLVGEDGYLIFDMGKEDGIACIEGAMYESIEDWKKFDEVCRDIIKNKQTDYPELKIIVLDTIDQLFEIAEPQVIKMYNNEKMGEKNFKKCTSINAAYGGYGKGLDKVIELVLSYIWALKKAGITVWMCGHTKTKDIVDPYTDQSYSTISADLSQKYFNAIKTKVHITGMAVIDRDIVVQSTGRTDIHDKEITKNKIISEARKIIFRDDNFGVDSKSRFRNIAPEIPLDTDKFIEAIKDAIEKAQTNPDEALAEQEQNAKSTPVQYEEEESTEPVESEETAETAKIAESNDGLPENGPTDDDTDIFSISEDEPPIEKLISKAQVLTKAAPAEIKAKVKEIVQRYGKLTNVDREGFAEIFALFE